MSDNVNNVKITYRELDDAFEVHVSGNTNKYFTLYISTAAAGEIDDISRTKKIIPFVSNGTYLLIDKSYRGMWLHLTDDNVDSVLLQ